MTKKAVILAAGVGSRLRPMTHQIPKTLIKVNDKPMLGHIIQALINNDITEILVVVGYKKEKILNYCNEKFPYINFKFIENVDYENTNNMFSFNLVQEYLNEEYLLMNADLVFDEKVINLILKSEGTSIAVDKGRHMEESMKLIVDENNEIIKISKQISKNDAYGCSIDVYKIGTNDINTIKQELKRILEIEKDYNQWTEVMLDNLFKTKQIIAKPCEILDSKWYEIDNYEDLEKAEILFNQQIYKLKDKKIFFLDRDGTLTIEKTLIPGSDKFVSELKKNNKNTYICTNNSSITPKKHSENFKEIGIDINESETLVSISSAIEYIKSKNITEIFWVATEEVSKYLINNGFRYNENTPDAVLLTYDTEINYEKITKLTNLVKKGIPYYATHNDIVCPTENGPIPDIGSFIEMIFTSTNIKPNKTFGKPSINLIKPILEKLNLKESDAVIIGDRLYTDIKLAENSEITSILVLSGDTKRGDYEFQEIRADIIVPSVKELIKFI
jgi:HAD superfamily hydrolase (TIGR01450 family)